MALLSGQVPILFSVSIIFLGLYQVYKHLRRRNEKPLPPSPPGAFLLGNSLEVAREAKKGELHILLNKWAQQYGDIFGIQIGPFTEYYVNTDVAVKEIFDRSSAQTAERPRWIVANELICNSLNVLLLNGSQPRWKHQRRAIHSGLTSIPKANAGLPYLHFETLKFLTEVIQKPEIGMSSEAIWESIGRYTYSTFASQTFGMDVPDSDNQVIGYIYETGLAQIVATLPGQYIVDVLPWLEYLPLWLKPWETAGQARHKRDFEWCLHQLERIKDAIKNGKPVVHDAFLPSVLNDEKRLGFADEEEPAYLSLMLIMGAADTSRMSTWSFLEAMIMFPEVQDKARTEIEKVVGDRIPVFEDLDNIPYVRCLMKEVWRWRPPVALGHPHTTTRELVYKGYHIPKGARLHLNAWAIGHNPSRHEDPERFWPERFADDPRSTMESINVKDPRERDHFAFGAGRRVCTGYHVAERSLAVAIMRMLWAFDIKPSPEAKLPLNPSDYRDAMPGVPGSKLPVSLIPNSEEKSRIIIEEYEKQLTQRLPLEPLA